MIRRQHQSAPSYFAECDGVMGCENTGPGRREKKAAISAAKGRGWHEAAGVTICPDCLVAMRLDNLDNVKTGNPNSTTPREPSR